VKRSRRLVTTLGLTTGLAIGAFGALSTVNGPAPKSAPAPATSAPADSGTQAQLAQLRAELAGDARRATELRTQITRLQRSSHRG
jgi:hypothetical protein